MYCEAGMCDSADDSIKVTVNEKSPIGFEVNFDYENIGEQRVWRKYTYFFTTVDSLVEVENKQLKSQLCFIY